MLARAAAYASGWSGRVCSRNIQKENPGAIDQFGIDPKTALMAEDMARNLKPAKALGMTTVWIDNGSERGSHDYSPDFVDVRVADLGEWLEQVVGDEE